MSTSSADDWGPIACPVTNHMPRTYFAEHRGLRHRIHHDQCRRRDAAPVSYDGLEPDERMARIRHARENEFAGWEVAALIPAPVTDAELAEWRGDA